MTVWVWAAKLAAAVGPALVFLLYFHEQTGARASGRVLAAALAGGTGTAFAALGLERLVSAQPPAFFSWLHDFPLAVELGNSGKALAQAYVIGGVLEEGTKLLCVGVLLLLFRTSLPLCRAVILSIVVACGFAATENALFILSRSDWTWIAVLRALLPVPGHMFLGAIMAFFLVLVGRGGLWRGAALLAFLVPAFLHGTGDYLIAVGSPEIDAPDHLKLLVRQVYAVLMSAEVLFAVLVARYAGRMEQASGPSGMAAARLWGRHSGWRRFFWSSCAVVLALFALFILSADLTDPKSRVAEFNIGGTLVLGLMAFLFALLFWVHGGALRGRAAGA